MLSIVLQIIISYRENCEFTDIKYITALKGFKFYLFFHT